MKTLSAINPAEEKVPVTFDFSRRLAEGETISSAEVSVTIWNAGDDDAPEDILDGSPTIVDDSIALQHVTPAEAGSRTSGGLPGVDYKLVCVGTTTGVNPARKIAIVSVLPVRDNS